MFNEKNGLFLLLLLLLWNKSLYFQYTHDTATVTGIINWKSSGKNPIINDVPNNVNAPSNAELNNVDNG